MQIQAFCLPVTLDAQPNFNSKSDIITDSFFGQPDIMLVHAKNKGMIMNLRSEMTYGHNVRTVYGFNPKTLPLLFHASFMDILDKLGEICKVNSEVIYGPVPEIHFVGHVVGIELAKLQLNFVLDYLNEIPIGSFHVPLHVQYLIAGNNSINIETIMKKTNTTIYLQPSLSHTFGPFTHPYEYGTIHVTGEREKIEMAKTQIQKLISEKSPKFYETQISVDPIKIDWLLLNKRKELDEIMVANGSYIFFPDLCSQDETVKIMAEDKVSADCTICLLNQQVCNIHEVEISFKDDSLDEGIALSSHKAPSFDKMYDILSQVSAATQAELTYNSDDEKLHILGTPEQVRDAACKLCEFDRLEDGISRVVFSLEFLKEKKDFIIGKGKGKVKNIKARCDVSMRFQAYNNLNSVLRIDSHCMAKAINGYIMVLQELPAEISFYIPESQHRRIIGTGGKNIQRIMREYCVYVKFLSSNKKKSPDDQKHYDNVFVRTPTKNSANLWKLKNVLLASSTKEKAVVLKDMKNTGCDNFELIGVELNDADLEGCLMDTKFFNQMKKKIENTGEVIINQYIRHPHGLKDNVQFIRCFEEKRKVLIYALQCKEIHTGDNKKVKEIIKESFKSAGLTFTKLEMKDRNMLSFLDF
ncbi:unnamed protein product [Rhizopus stolonifer]